MALDEWLFLVLVAILPVMGGLVVQFREYMLPPADFLFPMVAVAYGVSVARQRRRLQWMGWHGCLFLFTAAVIVAAVASENPHRSVIKLGGQLYLVGLAFLTTNYVTTSGALRRALVAWLVGAAMTAAATALGVVLFLSGIRGPSNPFLYPFGSLPPGSYPRVMALFLNANMLCTYAVASTMLLLATRAAGWIRPLAFAVLFPATVLTAVLSLSPGLGGLCLVLGLWYSGAMRPSAPRIAALLVIAGWAGAILFFLATTVSPTTLVHRDSLHGIWDAATPSSRVMTWTGAWNTFRNHPWFGKGLGLEVADAHYVNASGHLEILTDAHNTWLSILAQDGVVGLTAFLFVAGFLVRRFRPVTTHGSPILIIQSGIELAWIGGFLYQTLSGSFENTRHVWVLTGMVASIQRIARQAAPSVTQRGAS